MLKPNNTIRPCKEKYLFNEFALLQGGAPVVYDLRRVQPPKEFIGVHTSEDANLQTGCLIRQEETETFFIIQRVVQRYKLSMGKYRRAGTCLEVASLGDLQVRKSLEESLRM